MHRLCRTVIFVCTAMACFGATVVARAQAGAASQGDEAAVRSASKDFQAAARHGDESALRKAWTPDGEFVDATGRVSKASELIQRLIASRSSDSGTAADSVVETTIRFITPDVASEDGMTDQVLATDGGLLTRRLNAVWVKRNGKWLLDSLHETLAETSPFNEHLKPLEWLLGDWAGTTDDAAILVSSHWSDGGNFILRDFVFTHDGGETITATQRIGWDPTKGQIKSWTFDSQGGAGEERWRLDGKRWLVETVDVMPDGKQGKTSSIYVPGNERRYTWEVAGADVAGVKLKPMRVEFQRAAGDE